MTQTFIIKLMAIGAALNVLDDMTVLMKESYDIPVTKNTTERDK